MHSSDLETKSKSSDEPSQSAVTESKEVVQQVGDGTDGDYDDTSDESVEDDTVSERETTRERSNEDDENQDEGEVEDTAPPPLPDEEAPPPLPNETLPGQRQSEDDGWDPVWDDNAQAFYFHNRFTGLSQWENPRVPDLAAVPAAPGTEQVQQKKVTRPAGGYDPAIHGDYDPNADYAKAHEDPNDEATMGAQQTGPGDAYAATGTFNRFTGRWQAATLTPENFNDDAKSRRQMNAFFDVDAAANSHDGRSLKAERSAKKLSRKEVKAFREKRRDKKEEKRRAWLRD